MEAATPTVELYVRSLRPAGATDHVDDAVSRLRALADAGDVADVEVAVWGRQLPLDGPAAETDAAASIRETVREIEEWAAAAGVDVDARFPERVVDGGLAGHSYRARSLPTCCLVERVDGEIRAVAPHDRDGETRTVADRLASLEARASVTADAAGADSSAIAD